MTNQSNENAQNTVSAEFSPEVIRAFADQPAHIRKLIVERPDYWNAALFAGLLRSSLETLLRDYEKVESRARFTSKHKIAERDIYDFFLIKTAHLRGLSSEVVDGYKDGSRIASQMPPDPLEIKRAAAEISSVMRELIGWKKHWVSIEMPEITKPMAALLLEMADVIAQAIKEMLEMLELLLQANEHEGLQTLIYEINPPDGWSEKYEIECEKLDRHYDSEMNLLALKF